MYHVFFTNELGVEKNVISLFGESFVKKPYILENYRRTIGPNGKTYLIEDESKKVEGSIVSLDMKQLWLMDQWMDLPLGKRKAIKIKYNGDLIELYLYLFHTDNSASETVSNVITKDNIEDFTRKKNMDTLGDCDLHLIYPCSFNRYEIPKDVAIIDGNCPCESPYRTETQEELDQYEESQFFICKLHENNRYEFNDPFIKEIIRIPLGTVKCSFTYDGNRYVEYGFAYISKHRITEIGTYSIVFPCISNPVLLQLYAFCEDVLKIVEGDKELEVTEWLRSKEIDQYGYPKAIIFSYKGQVSKCDLLKCLAFEMEPIDEIVSKRLNEWASDNIAQYKLAEVYASDRCMVEMRSDIEMDIYRRLKAQAVEIFFIEILLFQEAAISRICSKVADHLNEVSNTMKCKNSFDVLTNLSKEMANAIMFIDHKRLRYPSVRLSSEQIAGRFGLPEELEKYYRYREILDEMINLNSNEQDKIESTLMNFLLLILTMIQVIPTLQEFAKVLMSGEIRLENVLSLGVSLGTCILFYLLYKIFTWNTIRRLAKKRGECKSNYGRKQ